MFYRKSDYLHLHVNYFDQLFLSPKHLSQVIQFEAVVALIGKEERRGSPQADGDQRRGWACGILQALQD